MSRSAAMHSDVLRRVAPELKARGFKKKGAFFTVTSGENEVSLFVQRHALHIPGWEEVCLNLYANSAALPRLLGKTNIPDYETRVKIPGDGSDKQWWSLRPDRPEKDLPLVQMILEIALPEALGLLSDRGLRDTLLRRGVAFLGFRELECLIAIASEIGPAEVIPQCLEKLRTDTLWKDAIGPEAAATIERALDARRTR